MISRAIARSYYLVVIMTHRLFFAHKPRLFAGWMGYSSSFGSSLFSDMWRLIAAHESAVNASHRTSRSTIMPLFFRRGCTRLSCFLLDTVWWLFWDGGSSWGGASLGRVFVMAPLRFGHQKNTSRLMAPVLSWLFPRPGWWQPFVRPVINSWAKCLCASRIIAIFAYLLLMGEWI